MKNIACQSRLLMLLLLFSAMVALPIYAEDPPPSLASMCNGLSQVFSDTATTQPLKFQIDVEQQRIVTASKAMPVAALQFMGQRWSKPTQAVVNWQGKRKSVLLLGGGYDATGKVECSDPRFHDQGYGCPSYDPEFALGAGIYMFDAENGDLLWWSSAKASNTWGTQTVTRHADLKYSVVGQINSIDRDGDGLSDAFYFADLGGQVFRVDLNNQENDSNKLVRRVVRIFDAHQDRGLSPRFYGMPSFSVHTNPTGQNLYGMIAVSSGNASSPQLEGDGLSAQDGIFVVYDDDIVRPDLYQSRQLNSVDIQLSQLTQFTADFNLLQSRSQSGWWYPFSPRAQDVGKIKGLGDVIVIDHQLYAHVYHTPEQSSVAAEDACAEVQANVGQSYLYQLCLPDGRCAKSSQPSNRARQYLLGAGIMSNRLQVDQQGAVTRLSFLVERNNAQETCSNLTDLGALACLQFNFILRLQSLSWLEQRAE